MAEFVESCKEGSMTDKGIQKLHKVVFHLSRATWFTAGTVFCFYVTEEKGVLILTPISFCMGLIWSWAIDVIAGDLAESAKIKEKT